MKTILCVPGLIVLMWMPAACSTVHMAESLQGDQESVSRS